MSDTKELEVKAKSLGAEANAIAVTDEASYRSADAFGRAAKALLAEIDASYDPIIAAAHSAHKTSRLRSRSVRQPSSAIAMSSSCRSTFTV